jgi:uncharacterized iron-regulated protein
MTIYLYKKTHKDTGLKYLGKTIATDPYVYPGSGTYWTKHLEKHGNNVETEILRECVTEEELKFWGQHYSKLWNVVESKEWANLIEEAGPGGFWSNESREKLSRTNKESLAKLTPEQKSQRMKNSCCAPESYTPQRIENMRKGMIGKKKTKTPKLLAAIESRRERSIQNMLRAADNHRGKTWKLIDGKRVWLPKENLV